MRPRRKCADRLEREFVLTDGIDMSGPPLPMPSITSFFAMACKSARRMTRYSTTGTATRAAATYTRCRQLGFVSTSAPSATITAPSILNGASNAALRSIVLAIQSTTSRTRNGQRGQRRLGSGHDVDTNQRRRLFHGQISRRTASPSPAGGSMTPPGRRWGLWADANAGSPDIIAYRRSTDRWVLGRPLKSTWTLA